MTAFRGVFSHLACCAALVLSPAAASSEPDADTLKRAAGAYLYAVEIVSQFERSRCRTVIRKKVAPRLEQTVEEIARHLPADDVAELRLFLTGEEFRQAREDNRRMLEEWFQSLTSRDLDERAACETIGSNVTKVYDIARRRWQEAKDGDTNH